MEYERELKDEDCTTSEDQDVQNQKDSLKENPNTFLQYQSPANSKKQQANLNGEIILDSNEFQFSINQNDMNMNPSALREALL